MYSLPEPREAHLLPNCVSSWEQCSQQIPDPNSSAQGFLKLFLSNASGQPDQNLLLMKQHVLCLFISGILQGFLSIFVKLLEFHHLTVYLPKEH